MPKRSRRRIANPLLSGSSPDRRSMLEWCNWQAHWSQKPVPSGVRVRVSPPVPTSRGTEGAGAWSPSRFENFWAGDEPVGFDSSALCQVPGCSWESTRSPKPRHSVRITAPVPRSSAACRGRGGRQATALLTRQASARARLGSTPRPSARFVRLRVSGVRRIRVAAPVCRTGSRRGVGVRNPRAPTRYFEGSPAVRKPKSAPFTS